LLIIACALVATPAYAQTADATIPREWGDRTLRGHTFPYPGLQETAFVTTHFGVRQGFAFLRVPDLPLGQAGTFDLSATGLVQSFDLGVKILDWLGVFVVGDGQLVTGVNVPSLVLTQNSFTAHAEGGAIVRVARVESSGTQIAVRASGGAGIGRGVSVLNLISGIASAQNVDATKVLTTGIGQYLLIPESSYTFAGSLHVAQPVAPVLGLQAAFEARRKADTQSPYDPKAGANVDQTTYTTALNGSVAVSLDGAPAGFPLALQPEYELSVSFASDGAGNSQTLVSHIVGAGIYYTGRRDLQVGIAGAMLLGLPTVQGVDAANRPADSGSPSLYYGQFILRYIW
jgi:hypothetical protein